jgi:hypothetical protein
MAVIAREMAQGAQARAQGWTAAGWAATMAGLTALCGSLYPTLGDQIYWLMSAVAASGGCLLLVGRSVERGSVADRA